MGIQNRFFLLIFLILISLAGCGDAFRRENFPQASSTPGYTTVSFGKQTVSRLAATNLMEDFRDFQGPALLTAPSGGSMIYAWNLGHLNKPTTKRIDGSTGSMTLLNGNYIFGLIGSSVDPIAATNTTIYSALGKKNNTGSPGDLISLNGELDTTISFTTTAYTASSSDIFQYKPLKLGICSSGTDVSTASSATSSCSSFSAGSVGSADGLKIIFASANEIGIPLGFDPSVPHGATSLHFATALVSSNSLVTGCISLATVGVASSFPIPVGYSATNPVTADRRLRTFIVSYVESNCTTINKVYEFPKGMWAASQTTWHSGSDPNFIERDKDTGTPVGGAAAVKYSSSTTDALFIRE